MSQVLEIINLIQKMVSEIIACKLKGTIKFLLETKLCAYTNDFIGKYMENLTTLTLDEVLKETPDTTRDAVRAFCYTVFYELMANDFQHLFTKKKMEIEVAQILLTLK